VDTNCHISVKESAIREKATRNASAGHAHDIV
jgi:hypothetical protein